jgi:hypothetical protein
MRWRTKSRASRLGLLRCWWFSEDVCFVFLRCWWISEDVWPSALGAFDHYIRRSAAHATSPSCMEQTGSQLFSHSCHGCMWSEFMLWLAVDHPEGWTVQFLYPEGWTVHFLYPCLSLGVVFFSFFLVFRHQRESAVADWFDILIWLLGYMFRHLD